MEINILISYVATTDTGTLYWTQCEMCGNQKQDLQIILMNSLPKMFTLKHSIYIYRHEYCRFRQELSYMLRFYLWLDYITEITIFFLLLFIRNYLIQQNNHTIVSRTLIHMYSSLKQYNTVIEVTTSKHYVSRPAYDNWLTYLSHLPCILH